MSESGSVGWSRRRLRQATRENQWLLPMLGALAGLALALIVGSYDILDEFEWSVSVDRSRETMMSLLGLVFTTLGIVLALVAVSAQNVVSRFGSRVLRIYLSRSAARWVLSLFALTATFIVTEQFQLRALDPDAPAPPAGLVASVVLLTATGIALVGFIAAVTKWFRVDRSLDDIRAAVQRAMRAAARSRVGATQATVPKRPADAIDLLAPRSGYVAEVHAAELLQDCGPESIVVITTHVNAAAVANEPIGWLTEGPHATEPGGIVASAVDIGGTRELIHSVDFGIVAMVDIAIIALSPAVNDPNTAVEVIEEMSFLFKALEQEDLGPYATPSANVLPRAVVNSRSFGELVELATTQIVLYGVSDPNVAAALSRFATSLGRLDLSQQDRRYVDAFAAKLAATGPATGMGPAVDPVPSDRAESG